MNQKPVENPTTQAESSVHSLSHVEPPETLLDRMLFGLSLPSDSCGVLWGLPQHS